MNSIIIKQCCIVIFVVIFCLISNVNTIVAQEPLAPLTKDELRNLCQQNFNNPDFVLNNFVRRNKIAFLPTKTIVRFLNENRCSTRITDELKRNFASRIVYRVCKFNPVGGRGGEFARILSEQLGDIKNLLRSEGDLLSDKTFDPSLANADGLTREELNDRPHDGFVLIMGSVSGNNNQCFVSARLVFMSKSHGRMEIGSPKRLSLTNNNQESVAEEIARWSITEVENQIR